MSFAPTPLAATDHDVLLVIDMQRDFLPALDGVGGALAVTGGDEIVAGINALSARFDHVILTQDWHPTGHISFASRHDLQPFEDTVEAAYGTQHLWPDHCVQGTVGAELHPGLAIAHAELLLRKGFRRELDSYSAFTENDSVTPTGLGGYLRERGLSRVFITGVAYDYCVGYSALAAAKLGFAAYVVEDLTRGIAESSREKTNTALAALNVRRVVSSQLDAFARKADQ